MKSILMRLLPPEINNDYKGYKIALYIFYLLTIVTLWRSQHHLFAPDGGAQSIATIPLDAFTESGKTTVIGIFSLWGLSQLIIGLMYLITAIRYRSMVPLWYLLMFVEYFTRAAYISAFKPVVTMGTAPGAVANIPVIIVSLIMLVLALMTPREKNKESLK